MSFYLDPIDFQEHNEEARRVWDAFRAGKPYRVPMLIATNPRIILLNSALNPEGYSFKDYSEDPDLMVEIQLRKAHYVRHHIMQDAEMGLPKDGWQVVVDLQTYYDAAWFGAEVEYRDGQVPDTRPILNDDNKRMLFDRGIPDPFKDGIMARNWAFYEHVKGRLEQYSHAGLPVTAVTPAGLYMDGAFTVASSLRGATELCADIYEDPDYVHELLGYITDSCIVRIKAYRQALDMEMKPRSYGFADDSIELLSVDTYREFVLPCHKRFLGELAGDGPHAVHLCGNVDRHLPVLKQELNVGTWDAGFPVDCGAMRSKLGPDIVIQTGPRVATLLHGTPADVDEEARWILQSGIMEGGKFVLHEANNLSPGTPVENITAMYGAAFKYGMY